ncbi:MAG: MGH1-like glycoside hydrolase domain-containing protein [Pirellulaceae bacterium]
MTDWASMDNSPRNEYLAKGGTAVDTSSQMVLFANHLAQMADLLGKGNEAVAFRREAAEVAKAINDKMWNVDRKFYFDLTVDGSQASAKTIAAYWTLLAGVASSEQATALVAELRNPASFGRCHRVPTTPADQSGYDPAGGYWRGAVWSPTNTMVVRGLERYGQRALAHELAMEHLRTVGEVFQTTGTVWENYAPDSASPGKPAKPDFVGWTGIVPILYFIEYAVGLQPDAPNNRLTWVLSSEKRCDCERFRFNGHIVTLVAEPRVASVPKRQIVVESDGRFQLQIVSGERKSDVTVQVGKNVFEFE